MSVSVFRHCRCIGKPCCVFPTIMPCHTSHASNILFFLPSFARIWLLTAYVSHAGFSGLGFLHSCECRLLLVPRVIAMHYVLLILWMTSCFHIVEGIGLEQRRRVYFIQFARWRHQLDIRQHRLVEISRWRHWGQVYRLQLHLVEPCKFLLNTPQLSNPSFNCGFPADAYTVLDIY